MRDPALGCIRHRPRGHRAAHGRRASTAASGVHGARRFVPMSGGAGGITDIGPGRRSPKGRRKGAVALGLIGLLLLVTGALLAACSEEGGDSLKGKIASALPDRTADAPPQAVAPASGQDAPSGQEQPPATDVPAPEEPEGGQEQATQAPGAVGDDGSGEDGVPWGWIGLAVALALAALLLIGWLRGRGATRQAEHSDWRQEAMRAYAEGAAIHDALAVEFAEGSSDRGATEAWTQRWRDAQRRMSDFGAGLHALETATPDDASTGAVRVLLAVLSALRSSIQSNLNLRIQEERAAEAQIEESAALIRGRLAELSGALRGLRESAGT